MGKLQLKIDGNDFTGVLADNPVIKDQLNACCRTLTFKLSLYGNRLDLLAHKVELFYKGKRWFIGEIKKQKEEHDGTNSITAYDPLFLFGKHEDDYYFKNQTATQIIKSMAKKIPICVIIRRSSRCKSKWKRWGMLCVQCICIPGLQILR